MTSDSIKERIAVLKTTDYASAREKALPVKTSDGTFIGTLIPVGKWALQDREIIQAICDWRQRAMRMFLVQFDSTPEKTSHYLSKLSVAQHDRIFFMIRDETDRLVGHMGLANITEDCAELDNVMRGVAGGHPRLIHFCEATLLDWAFKTFSCKTIMARVLSFNWPIIHLHEELGFLKGKDDPLFKYKKDDTTFHDVTDAASANVRYHCSQMLLSEDGFYRKNPWLRPSSDVKTAAST